jgi:adenylate cyclase
MSPPSTGASTKPDAGGHDRTAGLLRRLAVMLGIARARLPLAAALALAFGLMLLTTLAVVLSLAFYAGTANTRHLLADRSNLLLDTLEDRIASFLTPVATQLDVIATEMADAEDPSRLLERRSALHGILAATPQVLGVLFVTPELQAYRYRRETGAEPAQDWRGNAEMADYLAEARLGRGVVWGPPVWSPELRETIINANLPIAEDGRLAGLLFAAVGLKTMVDYVDELSTRVGQPVFVLQGRSRVVAVPGLDPSIAGPDRPLPLLTEAGDPVLATMWDGSTEIVEIFDQGVRGSARLVSANDVEWVVLYREIVGFGNEPWIVGTYLPASVAGAEIRRLWHALLLSLGCLLAAVAATFWLGRRMARPVERLAQAAGHIQKLELDAVGELPRSYIKELDQAARAFNAMRNGLSWFETYVPRRLVSQLMANPSPDVVASREIEVTVLFTDIVGFSRLAEQLDASHAASLLNQHFELLAGCVGETDGTVDKFLGDGMMAFWGAPMPQPDHAARAVRAALLIRDRLRGIDGFPPLRLRLGLHTGLALVGNIGARDRLNYTLVGDTVNVTQRLEQLGKEIAPADPIVILASAATATYAEGLCTVEPLGLRQLRGRDETVEVFRLR